jgi:hypothetical protein
MGSGDCKRCDEAEDVSDPRLLSSLSRSSLRAGRLSSAQTPAMLCFRTALQFAAGDDCAPAESPTSSVRLSRSEFAPTGSDDSGSGLEEEDTEVVVEDTLTRVDRLSSSSLVLERAAGSVRSSGAEGVLGCACCCGLPVKPLFVLVEAGPPAD